MEEEDLILSLESHALSRRGKIVRLTSSQTSIVRALNKKPFEIVTLRELMDEVYGKHNVGPDKAYNSIHQSITYLRKLIRPLGMDIINEYNKGFRLILYGVAK